MICKKIHECMALAVCARQTMGGMYATTRTK